MSCVRELHRNRHENRDILHAMPSASDDVWEKVGACLGNTGSGPR